ncbi:MAG: hypothetical protein RR640_05565 [Oscillospiraceae bacterium]
MKKHTSQIVKGAAITAAIGAGVGIVASQMKKGHKKSFKKTATNAVKSIGKIADNMQKMM